jgi:hypothetical protein
MHVQLNHYIVKSRSEFLEKHKRGGGNGLRRPLGFFDWANKHCNAIEDRKLLDVALKLKQPTTIVAERQMEQPQISLSTSGVSVRHKVAVIGLYRSGSSAIAGVLDALGVWMGKPYFMGYYEPASLAQELRTWWAEPTLVEARPAHVRVDGLRRWLEQQAEVDRPIIGAKHPLLTLSAFDVLAAWGSDTRFIWAYRDLDASIESLKRAMPRMSNPHLIQGYLWARASSFCQDHAHLRIAYDELLHEPQRVVADIAKYLELDCTAECITSAAETIRIKPRLSWVSGMVQHLRGSPSRTEVINWLIQRKSYSSYLEIGLGDLRNFYRVRCHYKVGVDPRLAAEKCSANLYRMTSDEFFERTVDKFDLIFIDGFHVAEVFERDVNHALKRLTPRGLIVCHDVNPTTEEMQRVPRVSRAWTGDCWKAWVKFRRDRVDLAMAVADTDHGLGLVVPYAPASGKSIQVKDGELTWEHFIRSKREWLNLISVEDVEQFIAGGDCPDFEFTVVTLWRGEWLQAQERVLEWIRSERLPVGTRFVWVTQEDAPAAKVLEEAWTSLDGQGREYTCELVSTPVFEVRGFVEKHKIVAELYNEALTDVRTTWVLFLEDDVVPPEGAVTRLLMSIQTASPIAGAVGAAYRRRRNVNELCAQDAKGRYIRWPDKDDESIIDVMWTGGGLTLYRGEALRSAGRLFASVRNNSLIGGWDVNLCNALRRQGQRVLVDMSVRATHDFTVEP